jgi:hypothetical protein
LKQDDLIIHYHCLITISELNNDSFLTVSGDSEIISYVDIRLNTLKQIKISYLLKIDLNQRQQFFMIDRIAYTFIDPFILKQTVHSISIESNYNNK